MSKVTPTSSRKSDHIRINLQEDVQSGLRTGLERLRFVHNALPELNFSDIDLGQTFLGKRLDAPILISGMTGGTKEALRINRTLAEAAQDKKVAMGLGSQRAAIEEPKFEATFRVRDVAPDILLFGNLGAVQLNFGYGFEECQRAVDMIEADALVFHLNPLQEALQPKGDVQFSDLTRRIEAICNKLSVPVIVKEVGWGISAEVAGRLVDAGVSAIDVAGAGGTSWSQVEMHRTQSEVQAKTASAFVSWGIPTVEAIRDIRETFPELPLIASGGLRTGIDMAKCLAIGADLGGMAGPFLKAATESIEAVEAIIGQVEREIQLCMFATGSKDLIALKKQILRVDP